MSIYLDYSVALMALLVTDLLGWSIKPRYVNNISVRIGYPVILTTAVLKTLIITSILKVLNGGLTIPVIAAFGLINLMNPYYVLTSGMAMGNPRGHRKKHMHYRLYLLISAALVSLGFVYIYMVEQREARWLGLISFLFISAAIVIPPREIIRSQQLLYGYRFFRGG